MMGKASKQIPVGLLLVLLAVIPLGVLFMHCQSVMNESQMGSREITEIKMSEGFNNEIQPAKAAEDSQD